MARYPAMERATEEAARRFKELLERAVARALGYLDDPSVRGLLIRRGAAQAQELLAALDHGEAIDELLASFRDLAAVLGEELEAQGISASASTQSIEALQAFVDGTQERLFEMFEQHLPAALTEIVEVGATSAVPLDSLVEDLGKQMETTVTQAVVEADTRLMGFDRLVVTEQSVAAGYRYFLYDGPLPDGIIRPFCREHAGKVYTLEELDALDNGPSQPKPVSVYLGGFGCRHYATPVTEEEARAYGRA